MGRNIFRDTGFRNCGLLGRQELALRRALSRAQFRAEFFNIFNHPNFANPFGGQNGCGHNDPSGAGQLRLRMRDTGRGRRKSRHRFGRQSRRATWLKLIFLIDQASPRRGRRIFNCLENSGREEFIVATSIGNRHSKPGASRPVRSAISFMPCASLLVCARALLHPGSLAQGAPERTIDEIKTEAVHRAEVGQYPLIGLDPNDVSEAFTSIHTRDKDEWAAAFMRRRRSLHD